MINQILNVDNHILAISPSKLIIFGFYEVMKCYFETPLLPCFSSFINDEKSIIFLTPSPPIVPFSFFLQFFFDVFPHWLINIFLFIYMYCVGVAVLVDHHNHLHQVLLHPDLLRGLSGLHPHQLDHIRMLITMFVIITNQ